MLVRTLLHEPFPAERSLNFNVRNPPFLHQGMRQNRSAATVKEVENPVVDTPLAGTQLVNAIAEKIRFRTPQLNGRPSSASSKYTKFEMVT